MDGYQKKLESKVREMKELDFQIKLSQSENDQLKKDLGDIDDKYRDQSKKYAIVLSQYESTASLMQKYQAQVEEQEMQLLQQQTQLILLEENKKKLTEENEEQRSTIITQDCLINQLKKDQRTYQEQITQLENQNIEFERKIKNMQETEHALYIKLNKLQREFDEKSTEFRQKEISLNEELIKVRIEKSKLQTDLDLMEDIKEKFEQKFNEQINLMQSEIDNLKALNLELEEENNALSKELNETKNVSSIDHLKQKQQYETQLNEQLFEIKDLNAQLKELQQAHQESQVKISLVTHKLNSKEKQAENLKKAYEDLKIEFQDYRYQNISKENLIKELRNENIDLKDSNARNEKIAKVYQQKYKDITSKMSNYNEEIQTGQKSEKDKLIKDQQDFIKVLEKELNFLQQAKQKLEEDKNISVQAANEQIIQMDSLLNENSELKEKLMKIQNKYDFDKIDYQINLAQHKDKQISRVVQILKDLYNFIENALMCTICQDIFKDCTMVQNCKHNYCRQCLLDKENQVKERCYMCRCNINLLLHNSIIDDIVDKYLQNKKIFMELLNDDVLKKRL